MWALGVGKQQTINWTITDVLFQNVSHFNHDCNSTVCRFDGDGQKNMMSIPQYDKYRRIIIQVSVSFKCT